MCVQACGVPRNGQRACRPAWMTVTFVIPGLPRLLRGRTRNRFLAFTIARCTPTLRRVLPRSRRAPAMATQSTSLAPACAKMPRPQGKPAGRQLLREAGAGHDGGLAGPPPRPQRREGLRVQRRRLRPRRGPLDAHHPCVRPLADTIPAQPGSRTSASSLTSRKGRLTSAILEAFARLLDECPVVRTQRLGEHRLKGGLQVPKDWAA